MFGDMPEIFWIFAGIALLVLATGYAKQMKSGSGAQDPAELDSIKQRLDRIEQHLDIR